MMTKNGPYFKAGVAIAPCTDYRLYDTAYTERSMGLPQENSAGYDSTSTITWIDRMKGSLLLMHGTADDNVHAQHTSHFVQAALKAGKDVEPWIHTEKPWDLQDPRTCIEEASVQCFASGPGFLCARIRTMWLKLDVVVAHAPHTLASQERNATQ